MLPNEFNILFHELEMVLKDINPNLKFSLLQKF